MIKLIIHIVFLLGIITSESDGLHSLTLSCDINLTAVPAVYSTVVPAFAGSSDVQPAVFLVMSLLFALALLLGFMLYRTNVRTKALKSQIDRMVLEIEEKNVALEIRKPVAAESFSDMKLLNDIAKSITSNLLAETIIDTVYENVSALMKSTVFAIGTYNGALDRLDFFGAYENGSKLPFFYNELSDNDRLAVWCFKNSKDVMILDYFEEYKNYIPHIPIPKAGENTQSLLYVPLIVKDRIIGVITVQSFKQNAYTDYHMAVLKNIANYTAIALENADAYMKIEKQNRDIEAYNIELERQKEEIQAQAENLLQANIVITEKNRTLTQLNEEKDKYLTLIDRELTQAVEYVVSLIPDPYEDNNLKIDWKFVPSTQLGGDAFGYHYIDDENLAIYLLDVCGHGIGPALHSISVINTLKFETLPNSDFRNPTEVLLHLNRAYQMVDHNDMYFTLWYGVYNTRTKELKYAGAGHPPALMIDKRNDTRSLLKPSNIFIGGLPVYNFNYKTYTVNNPSLLYIYSDGVFEIKRNNTLVWGMDELFAWLTHSGNNHNELEELYEYIQNLQHSDKLCDDFSIMRIEFK